MAEEPIAIDGLLHRDAVALVLTRLLAGERGAALVLRGERGIGKSACLSAATAMAGQTRLVLATAGSRSETHLPFAGLHRLLRPLLPAADGLPDGQRRALLAALGLREAAGRDSLVVRIAVLNLLVAAAADVALLISVDDAQWLDEDTRQVLGFVARRMTGHRMVLIAASSALRDDLVLGPTARDIVLDRLTNAEAHRLLAQRAGHLGRAHRMWVVEQAAGNPLALRELALTAASVDLSASPAHAAVPWLTEPLQRAFAGRVAELPDAARGVILVAALAADPTFDLVLAAAALLSGQPVGTDVLELVGTLGLWTLDDRRVLFSHPLVRVAIVQEESTTRRHAAHRALGEALAQNSRRGVWHRALGAAGPDDVIADELDAAALDSIRRGDISSAVPALERAAQLSVHSADRGCRLVQAAWHAARLGQADTVVRLLQVTTETPLSTADRVRADLIRDEFDVVVIADTDRMVRLCALARWAAAGGEHQLHLDLVEAAARGRCLAPVDPAALEQLLALTASLTPAGHARTAAVLALADPVGRGRELLTVVAAADRAALSDGDELTAYGVTARAVGDYSAAARFFDLAEIPLRARGLLGPLARNLCVMGDLRLDLGEWDRAAAALTGFEKLSNAAMSSTHRASALATSAKIAALRGDTATALERIGEIERAPTIRSGNRFLARAQIARGIACLSAGRPADAYSALSRLFDPADPSHHFREQFDGVAYLAEAAAHIDRRDEARRVVTLMRRVAEQSGSPFLIAQLAYADAVLADGEAAEQLFLTALTGDAGGSAWHRARTQLAFGRWLRRRQRVTESRHWLQLSLAVFRRLGAIKWTAEAADELRAAGISNTAPEAAGGAELLSAQELTIAQLAARGLTNRQIGEQLYLSPRTVSSHLYRLFPKLGITTRSQIATRLAETRASTTVSPW